MILVTLRRVPDRELEAQQAAIAQYRDAAAFHRLMARDLAAGCTHLGQCAGGPCVEAAAHHRMARRCEAQAWLESHGGQL